MAKPRFFLGIGNSARRPARATTLCLVLGLFTASVTALADIPDAGVAKKVPDPSGLRDGVAIELEKSRGNLSASMLRKLGKDVDLAVMDIASDAGQPLQLRVAAMRALGELDTPVARSYLMRHVQSTVPANAPEMRDRLSMMRAAVLALGWTRSEEAIPAIERLLAHPQTEVRLDAITALVLTRRPQALAALEFARPKEKDKGVRKKLDKQIDRLREAIKDDPAFRQKPLPPPRISQPPPVQQRFDPNRPEQRL
ncbi:MAG: HEAT repeat domain-containing protein [Deltaproteobacteria bacterium]|nr:HEAT repeat domain-containing protein [Deltaproteobacteria bacterium]